MNPIHLACILITTTLTSLSGEKPNVLLIVADDMGYADIGVNGCSDIPTPHLDALAQSGINFTAGYVTHPYCSPSRAAIMSGRYQARIGHDNNPQKSNIDPTQGILVAAELLPARLKSADYSTALIGKWHLGHAAPYNPLNRGFDHFFGFLSGGYSYWGESSRPDDHFYDDTRILPAEEITYMTTDLGHAALRFTEKQKDTPWFCFLSYNAPHAPDQAPKETIEKFSHIKDPKRRVYAALVSELDDSIGEVIAGLKEQGQLTNTLVIFISDNGGRAKSANNGIYRGHKGRTYEGGIRVPFIASWPGTIAPDQSSSTPVSSLDIYATTLALAEEKDHGAEGVDLTAFLTENAEIPARPLFFRIAGGWGYAVSKPPYKLVKPGWKDSPELYNVSSDPSEETDIADENPQIVQDLTAAYTEWNTSNIPPLWTDPHKENVDREKRGLDLVRD